MLGVCAVCGRESYGFLYRQPMTPQAQIHHACSYPHLKLISEFESNEMSDLLSKNETSAVRESIPVIGQFIESIGKTDLGAMTYDEFTSVIAFTFETVATNLSTIAQENAAPF